MVHEMRPGEDLWGTPSDEVTFPSWPALAQALASPLAAGWIFRGQRDAGWGLDAKLLRELRGSAWSPAEWEMAERSAIGYFKERARPYLDDPPGERDLIAWLSVMQHYGAPTRLLDWTASPFVAAYFAMEAASPHSDAALWALQAVYCRVAAGSPGTTFPYDEMGTWPHFGLSGREDPHLEFPRFLAMEITRAEVENRRLRDGIYRESPWPLPVLPHRLDARMSAQQAVFTAVGEVARSAHELWDPSHHPQQPAVRQSLATLTDAQPADFFERYGLPVAGVTQKWQILRKIRVPGVWRQQALDTLDRMGITRETLFPGLDGIGAATAHHLERRHPLRDLLAPTPTENDLPGADRVMRRPG